jgi:hypothetical protein
MADDFRDSVLFVDLDGMMSDSKNNVFRGIVHVNKKGRVYKAEQIGMTILEDLEAEVSKY